MIIKLDYHIIIYDCEPCGKIHNLNGPAFIFLSGPYIGALQYYIYGQYIGKNLSNKEFEKRKNIVLKKLVFE